MAVADECLRVYDEIKMGHRWLYIIYRVSEDLRTIIVEEKAGHGMCWPHLHIRMTKNNRRYGLNKRHN